MQVGLQGKVALVTGAAQGIGRSIADTLAQNGARVIYTDLDIDRAADAARTSVPCEKGHLAFAMDVSDGRHIDATVAEAAATAGRIDILVNNAGIGVRAADRKTIDEFPIETWDEMLRIDLTGVFRVSRAVIPHMKSQRSGRIINIASVLGLVPMRLQSSYVAAKAGVVNLTRSMAIELAPHGILVNGIAPGSTATEGWKHWIGDAKSEELDLHARLLSHIPLGRPASTQEIANGALFLAAPESSYITGHVLPIDGGWTAGFARDF
ncbi:SDR family NAD(P)-dependent oxidoreductase [Microvirga puerhi]|uniref:Glucose 1-dehydrogenase n=1 Tax=Microvirga puerhi TaxID=2876078 RepID=A0ABS7VU21_9HYPH|nr:glucose 1-dehydrogenase [Microvirga puerhi]MBZ6078457.1 glucose 1-dehydrogenase [Microvirga puerhi]